LLRFPLWQRTSQNLAKLRSILDEHAEVYHYRSGDLVFGEGDYGDSAMVVLSGAVRIVTEKPGEGLSPLERGHPVVPQQGFAERIRERFWQLFRSPPDREVRLAELVEQSSRLADLGEDERETPILLQDIPLVLDRHRTVRLGPGELFGELSALGRIARTASVFAEEERTRLLRIRWQGLSKLHKQDSQFREMLDEIYRQRSLRVHLRSTPAFARVGQTEAIESYLARGELAALFDHELGDGWKLLEGPAAQRQSVSVDGQAHALDPVAQGQAGKGRIVLWQHDGPIPPAEVRSRLEHHAWCQQPENIVVYKDPADGSQLWQWLLMEPEAVRVPNEYTLEPQMNFEGLVEGLLTPDKLTPEAPDPARLAESLGTTGDAKAALLAVGAKKAKIKKLQIDLQGETYKLAPLADLAGCSAFRCEPKNWPDHQLRSTIERRIRYLGDTLLVFAEQDRQLWRCRGLELEFDPAQPPLEQLRRFLHPAPIADLPPAWDEARRLLEAFELGTLLQQQLGWQASDRPAREVETDAGRFSLTPLAERGGCPAYHCAGAQGDTPEDLSSRSQIERALSEDGLDALIIFTDPRKAQLQIWRHAKSEYRLALRLPAAELILEFLLPGHIVDTTEELSSLISAIRRLDLDYMFVACLGWSLSTAESITIAGHTLQQIAQQQELVVYLCHPDSNGALPDTRLRDEIDERIAGQARKRLIVFTDGTGQHQVWRARTTTYRELSCPPGQPRTELIRKLIRPLIHDEIAREGNAILTYHGEYDRWQGDGPPIVQQGDPATALISIRDGFGRLTQQAGESQRTLSYLGRGGVYGLNEMLRGWSGGTPTSWDCTLRAQGYVSVVEIPQAVLNKYVLPTLSANQPDPVAAAAGIQSEMLSFLVDERVIHGKAAMLIDLDRCTRCDECVSACANTHQGNPRFIRQGPRHGRFMLASACLHCADPVCMSQCPTAAIHRDLNSGEVLINDATCIGCQRCAKDCPYHDIQMVPIRDAQGEPFLRRDRPVLKAVKCDLCYDQLTGPACQHACPHDALIRADLDLANLGPLARWLDR